MIKLSKNRIPVWLCFTLFVISIITYKAYYDTNILREGRRSTIDVYTTENIIDREATEIARKEAAANVQDVYRILPSIQLDIWDTISTYINTARELKADDSLSENQKVSILSEIVKLDLSEDILKMTLAAEFDDLNNLSFSLDRIVNQLMSRGITEADLDYEKKALSHTLKSIFANDNNYQISLALLENLLVPNEFVDEEATELERIKAMNRVSEIVIPAGTKIVSEGQIIDSHIHKLLEEAGLIGTQNTFRYDKLIAKLGIALILIVGMYFYFEIYLEDYLEKSIGAVLTIDILILVLQVPLLAYSKLFHPIGIAAVLVTILAGLKVSIINIPFLFLLGGQMYGLPTSLGLFYLIASIILSYTVNRNKSRSFVIMSSLLYGVLIALMMVVRDYRLILDKQYNQIFDYWKLIVNGILVGVISIGSLPIWERVFKILTDFRLMELSDSNNELLHRLLVEAPGTYHHSMMVGTLGEACAEAIGANSLICRVGGYYHDIGKLKRPMYFKENQGSMRNPHDDISPEESASIIIEHATYGVELGLSKKLPTEIIDIINEHHGTSVVGYFYAVAKQNNSDVDIEKFKYRGKKPQTLESAIIRLCDMCEASVRSIKIPTEQAIDEMVEKIFKSNLESDQLVDAPITLEEVYIVKDVLLSQIKSIYHGRIEYPKEVLETLESK